MYKLFFLTFLFAITPLASVKARQFSPEMYEYSPNSITGVYLCTPKHVESGDCRAVDDEYYQNLALISLGSYEIGILEANGEETMAFKGALSLGSADKLISLLKKYPHIKKLTLSSQGGAQEEAFKIVNYIKKNKFDTWVPVRRLCLSACTSVFLSGANMTLNGQLGFHTGSYHIYDSYQIRDLEAAQELIDKALFENNKYLLEKIKIYNSLSIPLSFIDEIVKAKGDFLIFTKMDDVINFDETKNYIKTLKDAGEFARNQEVFNFDFQKYTLLF